MTDTTTDEIQLPAIMGQNLPEPAVIAEQYRAAFGTIYSKIEDEIAGAKVDLTTKSGRELVASRAYKIARTKTGLQKAAKTLTEEQQAIINVVNAETKTMRERLDGLRDKARAPLNKWEADEEIRIAGIETGLATLRDLSCADATFSPDEIRASIQNVTSCFHGRDWGEYLPMAVAAHEAAITKFTSDFAASEKRIADEKELAELREQNAERERRAENKRIAAAEREIQARKDAAAQAERDEAERQRLADERAKQDAADRVQAEQDRADKAIARADKAEADAIAAKKKADQDKIDAAEFAVTEERNRQSRIAETEREAKEEREADLTHRKKINNASLKALIKCSEISTAQAKMIVQAMAKDQIPHVTISY